MFDTYTYVFAFMAKIILFCVCKRAARDLYLYLKCRQKTLISSFLLPGVLCGGEGGGRATQRFDNGTFIWLRAICVNGEKFTVFTTDLVTCIAGEYCARRTFIVNILIEKRSKFMYIYEYTKISFLLIKKIKLSDGVCIFLIDHL